MLVPGKGLLAKASRGGYALPAFNTLNLETTLALSAAAEKMKAPLFIQVTEKTIMQAGLENIFALIKQVEKNSNVPVCIHLDHGKDLKLVKKCISLGFKSVMVDASALPFEENVSVTKKAVAFAGKNGCSVEAELGALKRIGSEEEHLTDPKDASRFVEESGCDSLAVAIGTSHGAYKFAGKPKLDFARLLDIRENVSVPLVLHGASSVPLDLVEKINAFGGSVLNAQGVPEKDLKKAVKLGVAKVNIDTDLRLAFTAALREFFSKNQAEFDPRKYLGEAMQLVQETAEEKILLLGAKGKA